MRLDFINVFLLAGICSFLRKVVVADCHVNGVHLKNGDTFQRSCREECTCMNDAYACTSTCPHEAVKPTSLKCAYLELVQMPGQCCKEWMCLRPETDESKIFYDCKVPDTTWTDCTATCGVGISSRTIKKGSNCKLSTELKLCQLRPCPGNIDFLDNYDQLFSEKNCQATVKPTAPVHIRYVGCVSRNIYTLNYCGLCKGKCCKPSSYRDIRIYLQCPDDSIKTYSYTSISQCRCEPC
ncbi:CCN family member 1-like [Glandiceps talaboti]